MPKLFRCDPCIRNFILIIFLGLYSAMLFAQAGAPAPPATIDPSAPADGAAASSTESSVQSSSASSAKPPEKPLYVSTFERDNVLRANVDPTEALWLETPNEKFLALFKAGETRRTKGSLLILHASELPQLWPAPLENIRRNLPIYGWETMAVPLPQKYPAKTPERDLPASSSSSSIASLASASDTSASSTEASSIAESSSVESLSSSASSQVAASSSSAMSSEPAKPSLPREQIIAERVDAAIEEFNKDGRLNIVVLVDNSSAFDSLTELYTKINLATSNKDIIDGPVQALILVNLQEQEPISKEQLAAVFSIPLIPVMDVFFAPDDAEQKAVRRLHHAEAMRKNVRIYQQFVLSPEHLVTVDDKQSFWLEKVRGFMEKQAESKELKANQSSSAPSITE